MKIKIEEFNGKKKYWVNDVPYERLEDIPSEFREYFADKNNNGIPDQFDDLMDMTARLGGSAPLSELFNKVKSTEEKKSRSSSTNSSNIDQYLSQEEKPSGFPIIFKLAIAMVAIAIGVWVFIRIKDSQNPSAETAELTTSSQTEDINTVKDNETDNSNDRLTLVIEDPNAPPYHMVGVLYENKKRILSFELPDGQNNESTDSTLQVAMTVPAGTNLSEKTFRFSIQSSPCTLDENTTDDGQARIGQLIFDKSESGDAGAGQRYQTYQYSTNKNGKCLSFVLLLHSSNAEAFDPPLKEYDEGEQIAEMERILATIK